MGSFYSLAFKTGKFLSSLYNIGILIYIMSESKIKEYKTPSYVRRAIDRYNERMTEEQREAKLENQRNYYQRVKEGKVKTQDRTEEIKIIIDGVEPQFKIYKMSECIENKFYIGKTKRPLRERISHHRRDRRRPAKADLHFDKVGWHNVTVEIIDTASTDDQLILKEYEHILKYKDDKNMLNNNEPPYLSSVVNLLKTNKGNIKSFCENNNLMNIYEAYSRNRNPELNIMIL